MTPIERMITDLLRAKDVFYQAAQRGDTFVANQAAVQLSECKQSIVQYVNDHQRMIHSLEAHIRDIKDTDKSIERIQLVKHYQSDLQGRFDDLQILIDQWKVDREED